MFGLVAVIVVVVVVVVVAVTVTVRGWAWRLDTDTRDAWLRRGLQTCVLVVSPDLLPAPGSLLFPSPVGIEKLTEAMNIYFYMHRVNIRVRAREVEVLYAEVARIRHDSSLAGMLESFAVPRLPVRDVRSSTGGPVTGDSPTA